MNLKHCQKNPALVAAVCGLSGLALRAVLYRVGFDEKGILSASHPLHLACLALTALTLLYLALTAKRLPDEFRPRLRLLLGLPAGWFLIIQTLLLWRQDSGTPAMVRCILTAAGAMAMVVCVLPLSRNRGPAAFCHGLICVAFAGDMLCRYQSWSGNPQLPDYVFHVLAGVSLSLTAYHTLALHAGLSKPQYRKFWGCSALFLCLLCLAGPESRAFYLSGALWSAACLVTALEEEPVQEENGDVSA